MGKELARWADLAPGFPFEDMYLREHFFCRADHLITLHPFTVTNVNCTPALSHVGGRPCVSLAGGNQATDGSNWCDAAACIRPVAGKETRIRFGVRSADALNHSWCFGLYTLDTTIMADLASGGTPNSDYAMVVKRTNSLIPSFKCRKASGTEEVNALSLTLADATWYDFDVAIKPDIAVAGKGSVKVWCRTDRGAPSLVLNASIATQIPDTVSTCLCFGFLEGDTGTDATVVSAIALRGQY